MYELKDGTSCGCISARQWVLDVDCDKLPDNCNQLYVYIIGHLDCKVELYARNWVIAEHIHTVTNMSNCLFFHILETAVVTLSLDRGPPVRSFLCTATAGLTPRCGSLPKHRRALNPVTLWCPQHLPSSAMSQQLHGQVGWLAPAPSHSP